ncbi:MAG: hypothetical protein RLZZ505_2789 [Verrucomicrobiota bacterium]|jgi:hypothetical protein
MPPGSQQGCMAEKLQQAVAVQGRRISRRLRSVLWRGKDSGVEKERRPWWLYLNLLGLDAPLIAVTWLFLFARTWRVDYHPWQAYAALGFAAWTIRIAMKLLQGTMSSDEVSFVMVHRKWLKVAAVIAGVCSITLTVMNFPLSVYTYLLVGAVFVAGHAALTLFSPQEGQEIGYARHALAGIAFAYGIALTAHVYLPGLGLQELMLSREFICFAVLCLLASSALELWERSAKPATDGEAGSVDEIALSLPLTLLGAAALVFAVQENDDSMVARPFFYGILTGAALLQVLNRTRGRFTLDTLRVLTALCLLAPGIIFKSYPVGR